MEDIKDKKYGFIYITTNNINGKKYVGQKKYDDKRKWVSYLGSGIALNNAINKYGRENFSREIIEECNSKEQLDDREKYWIAYYDAVNSKAFYNIACGGDGGDTTRGHNESKKLIIKKHRSDAAKGKINIGSLNNSARKVICLNDMKIFECGADADRYYNLKPDSATRVCREKNLHTIKSGVDERKLQFDYYYEDKNYIYEPFIPKSTKKSVICIETMKVYKSAYEASCDLNLNADSIRKCARMVQKSTHGLHFLYYEKYLNMNNNEFNKFLLWFK